MIDFEYVRATDVDTAGREGTGGGARFVAGGTNLIDLMKLNVERPLRVIDINDLGRGDPALTTIADLPNGGVRIGADRKSTRLNSSHPSISYAVFCLKKKKKKTKENVS